MAHLLEDNEEALSTLHQVTLIESKVSSDDLDQDNSKHFNSSKDKNDNFQLKVLPRDFTEKICRTCFNEITADARIPLNMPDDPGYLENLIHLCLPKVDLLLTKDPMICRQCYRNLEEFYSFSINCMKTEVELQAYCSMNQSNNPIDISDFLRHAMKYGSDFIAVKEESQNLIADVLRDNSDNFDSDSNDFDVKTENEYNADISVIESKSKYGQVRSRGTKTRNLRGSTKNRKFSSKDLLETQVKCETCGHKFTTKWALDRHVPVHNIQNSHYSCEFCNLKFKYKNSYEKHLNAHVTGAPMSKPFACECGKFFNRKSKLKKHQEIHSKKEKPFACTSCGKRFLDQKLLDGHVERVHINEKAFSCELCGNKYTNKPGLDVHIKSHFPNENPRPEPDLMCDICGKLFYRKYSLEKHHMSHTGDKPHECDQCDMKFKERYQLTIHMRKHTGEKPFNCEVCDFKFSCKNRLGVHMRKHTGVRPFPCQLCDMAFTRNDHLMKHVRAIHTGERPFECDICNKTFNRKDYLLKHKKVHNKSS
ncbi:zinc finger protein OZF [Dendroctonus ponderosae]|uniref:zinc finger protein OZF n=1 Tax=Dendroctonus ponderosae TaxID=77166 RepID=UPI0020359E48|nr:zinc finger protein OZF [Dendroctonus ponderosae]